METQTQVRPKIEDFPVRQETNRERIIRFFHEHDGEPTCYGNYRGFRGARCAVGLMEDHGMWNLTLTVMGMVISHFDELHGSFGDYARHLEHCKQCWWAGADEPYTGD